MTVKKGRVNKEGEGGLSRVGKGEEEGEDFADREAPQGAIAGAGCETGVRGDTDGWVGHSVS